MFQNLQGINSLTNDLTSQTFLQLAYLNGTIFACQDNNTFESLLYQNPQVNSVGFPMEYKAMNQVIATQVQPYLSQTFPSISPSFPPNFLSNNQHKFSPGFIVPNQNNIQQEFAYQDFLEKINQSNLIDSKVTNPNNSTPNTLKTEDSEIQTQQISDNEQNTFKGDDLKIENDLKFENEIKEEKIENSELTNEPKQEDPLHLTDSSHSNSPKMEETSICSKDIFCNENNNLENTLQEDVIFMTTITRGLYSFEERQEKILKYKNKIKKWRENNPVVKRTNGKSVVANKKYRVKGRFVTEDIYMSYIKKEEFDCGDL